MGVAVFPTVTSGAVFKRGRCQLAVRTFGFLRGSMVRGPLGASPGRKAASLPGGSFEPGQALSVGHQRTHSALAPRASDLPLGWLWLSPWPCGAIRAKWRLVGEFLKPSASASTHFPKPEAEARPRTWVSPATSRGHQRWGRMVASPETARGACAGLGFGRVAVQVEDGSSVARPSKQPRLRQEDVGEQVAGPLHLASRPFSEPGSLFEATAPQTVNGRGGRHRLRSSSKLGRSGEREPEVLVLADPACLSSHSPRQRCWSYRGNTNQSKLTFLFAVISGLWKSCENGAQFLFSHLDTPR